MIQERGRWGGGEPGQNAFSLNWVKEKAVKCSTLRLPLRLSFEKRREEGEGESFFVVDSLPSSRNMALRPSLSTHMNCL